MSELVNGGKQKKFQGYRNMVLCFIYMFVGLGMVSSFGVPYASYFPEYYNTSLSTLSLGMSLTNFLGFLFSILAGPLIKKLGSRKLFLLGAISVFMIPFCYGISNSLVTYFLAFMFVGFNIGIFLHATVQDLMVKWFYDKRSQMIGIALAGGTFGQSAFQFIMGQMLPAYGVRTTFLVFAAIALVVEGLVALFIREPANVGQNALGYERDPEYLGTAQVLDKATRKAQLKAASAKLYRNPVFWLLIVAVAFLARSVNSVGDYGTGFLPEAGIPFTTAATIVSLMSLCTGLFTMFALGPMVAKLGAKKSSYILCIACIACCGLTIGLSATGMNWGIIIGMVLTYAVGMTAQPFTNMLAPAVFGTELAVAANTKFQGFLLGSGIITFFLWAVILERTSYNTLWTIMIAIGVVALVFFIAAFVTAKKRGMKG